MGGAWARTGSARDAARAAAPLRTARREMRDGVLIMYDLRWSSSAEKDALHVGIAGQLRRGSDQAVAAVHENISPVGETERLARVLLHHGYGHAVRVNGRDRLEELGGGARGETSRRLVEEEHGRLHHEGHGHGEDLALAAGERARRLPPLLGEHGEAREDRLDPRPAPRGIEEASHLEVLAHRHAGEDVLLLRHEGEAEGGDDTRWPPADGLAPEPHRALVWDEQPRDDLEERRLARAVGADDADDFARLESEINALEDLVGDAVAGDHTLHREERRRSQDAHWRSPMYAACTRGSAATSAKAPWASRRPSVITITGRQSRAIRSMLCSMTRKVRPRSPASASRWAAISLARVGLTPAMGSSRRIRRGSVMRARPISRSFFCPPDRVAAGSLATRRRLSRRTTAAARSRSSSSRRLTEAGCATDFQSVSPGWAAPYSIRFSSTDNRRKPRAIWKVRTRPRRVIRCGGSPVMSWPSKRTRPASGGMRPETQWKSVVFPAPFGPMSPVMVPASTSRSTPLSAWTP